MHLYSVYNHLYYENYLIVDIVDKCFNNSLLGTWHIDFVKTIAEVIKDKCHVNIEV